MKNLFYLFLLLILIPINTYAQNYYTEYEPYLLNQSERIETNDLIKEEVIENYYVNKEVKINTGYYPDNTQLEDKPYIDYNDKIIVSKREWYYQQTNYTKGLLYSTDPGIVNSFIIEGITHLPKFTLYDLNYNKLEYTIDNNLITLSEEIEIDKLLILFEIETDCQFTINFTNGFIFNVHLLKYLRPQYEINFVLKTNMKTRLQSMGVYTSAIYPLFEYHIYYTYHYLYYDKGYVEELSTDLTAIYTRKETVYNYYKREIINVKDYLLLNENNRDLNGIIESSSISIDDIIITENINYEINGVYEINISYKNIDLTRPIFILNQEEPIIIYQDKIIEKTCEPIIIEKEKLIPGKTIILNRPCNNQCPKIKETIKYVEQKDQVSSKISKNNNDFKLSYILPIVPFLSALILVKKRKKS